MVGRYFCFCSLWVRRALCLKCWSSLSDGWNFCCHLFFDTAVNWTVVPLDSHVEASTSNAVAFGDEVSGWLIRFWRDDGGTPWCDCCPYKRHQQVSSLSPFQLGEKTARSGYLRAKKRVSPEPSHADVLILDFQPLELWENWFLWFKPPSLQCFVMVAWADWYWKEIKRRNVKLDFSCQPGLRAVRDQASQKWAEAPKVHRSCYCPRDPDESCYEGLAFDYLYWCSRQSSRWPQDSWFSVHTHLLQVIQSNNNLDAAMVGFLQR